MEQRLPNFLIIGAPKSGTTTMYEALRQHPDVFMSPIKEPRFFREVDQGDFTASRRRHHSRRGFDLEAFLEGPMTTVVSGAWVRRWEDYVRLFKNAGSATAVGEATPAYLSNPGAPERIATRLPEVKLIATLRDPAARAFSMYLHQVRAGITGSSFRSAVLRELAGPVRNDGLIEPGYYYRHLSNFLHVFPRDHLWIGLMQDLERDPSRFLGDVCRFLGVEPRLLSTEIDRRNVARYPRFRRAHWLLTQLGLRGRGTAPEEAVATREPTPVTRPSGRLRGLYWRRRAPRLPQADRRWLLRRYRGDIESLQDLIGRDLDAWMN